MGNPRLVALRCLIVDDSALFVEGASVLLEREGVNVVGVARNSAEALRLVEELQPDVTLVDVDLGDESGFDLTQQLGSNGSAQPNVILISTHAQRDFARLIEASPALGFISKVHFSARAISDILERADSS